MSYPFMIGTRRRLKATFRDSNGTPTATTATLKVKKPDGTVTTTTGGSLQNPTTGVYYLDVTLDQGGNWTYRFEGTGALVDAKEETFAVATSRIP